MMRIDVLRPHGMWWAIAGALAAGAAWVALAMATGLIFHLMPAGPPLLAGALLRRAQARSVVAIGTGVAVSLAAATMLVRLGQPLDDPLWTLVVLSVGVALGSVLARRRSSATESQ